MTNFKRNLANFLFCGLLLANVNSASATTAGDIGKALSSPRGVAATAITLAVTTGISNFLWAFDWKKHANTSDDTKATIQEIGGLTAAAESFILAGFLPFWAYQYVKLHPAVSTGTGTGV